MRSMKQRKLTFEELKKRSYTKDEITGIPRLPVYVILENVRSLHNVGASFRTADALRIERLILTGFTGKPPRSEIDKVALGAVETVPWTVYDNSATAINELKKQGIQVIGLEQTTDSIDFQDFKYEFPVALILGHEFDGIEQETLDNCDACVEIPMNGTKQSLNVSTALGVLGYELFRQLRGNDSCKSRYRI